MHVSNEPCGRLRSSIEISSAPISCWRLDGRDLEGFLERSQAGRTKPLTAVSYSVASSCKVSRFKDKSECVVSHQQAEDRNGTAKMADFATVSEHAAVIDVLQGS